MKTLKNILLIMLIISASTLVYGQKFSAGIIGTSFFTNKGGEKFSELNNPIGQGIVFGYSINKDIAIALTGEYFEGNLSDTSIKEKNNRVHLSIYLLPMKFNKLSTYFSCGVVYSNQVTEAGGKENTENFFNGKIGLGMDYLVYNKISVNLDLGVYNDGLIYNGASTTIGLRYAAF
ncbi:MAG: hypothetical protein K9I71_13300 [Ignavibacteriales bacterium]|nr:hypothetical protein [Ignavibacteriales bacterium]MCF8438681.1 hypothetical protein [Ignavibacteriales bacterium]